MAIQQEAQGGFVPQPKDKPSHKGKKIAAVGGTALGLASITAAVAPRLGGNDQTIDTTPSPGNVLTLTTPHPSTEAAKQIVPIQRAPDNPAAQPTQKPEIKSPELALFPSRINNLNIAKPESWEHEDSAFSDPLNPGRGWKADRFRGPIANGFATEVIIHNREIPAGMSLPEYAQRYLEDLKKEVSSKSPGNKHTSPVNPAIETKIDGKPAILFVTGAIPLPHAANGPGDYIIEDVITFSNGKVYHIRYEAERNEYVKQFENWTKMQSSIKFR